MDIKCKNLKKIYDAKTVLNIDYLHIKRGSVLGIIGANGSGKTTLLYILSNLLEHESGEVLYDEGKFDKEISKKITLVFQKPVLLRTTVEKNIIYPLTLRKIEKSKKIEMAKSIMKKLELENFKEQNSTTLSAGEKQKIALARSAVISPEVLLLDEPTANIDPSFIKLMENTIMELNKKGTTIIIVTHNIMQAKRMCTDIIFMEHGNIIEQGKTKDILINPTTEKLKNFIEYGAV